jgi:hypothetical protein|tara:strand:- start:536 stop:913 length:378 start_codon:yes stop_codon:yes gene_type:complete
MSSTRIDLNRVVFNKLKYEKTIDTSFTELLPPAPEADETPILTVEQFFQAYNTLFFEIPKTGINSHNELIQTSTEYIGDEQSNAELDALFQEINNLRAELLTSQEELINFQTAQSQAASNSDFNV